MNQNSQAIRNAYDGWYRRQQTRDPLLAGYDWVFRCNRAKQQTTLHREQKSDFCVPTTGTRYWWVHIESRILKACF